MGCGNALRQSAPLPEIVRSSSTSFSTEEKIHKHWRILSEKLGEGSYADVYAVQHNRSDRLAAVKIPRNCSDDAKKEAMIWKEIGRHENILSFIADFTLDGRHVMLMEKCEDSLRQRFPDMSTISESATAHIFHQMASSIAHLESLRIVHRDVKPDNFLCAGDDPILKLCDFGFAKCMPASNLLFGTYGTPYFMSPEMVGNGPHDLKTDAWSLGASIYFMLHGKAPYGGREKSAKGVMKAIALNVPGPQYNGQGNVSDAAKDVVVALLRRQQFHRISASQALGMPFLILASKQIPAKMLQEGVESQSTAAVDSNADGWSFSGESLWASEALNTRSLQASGPHKINL
jgi:serine/threonine protein kinase